MPSSGPAGVESTTDLSAAELVELRELMDEAFGDRFDDDYFAHAMGGTHLIIRRDGRIASHAAVVERRLYVGDLMLRCGYLEAVATLPRLQRLGLAGAVMSVAADVIRTRFEMGALSTGSAGFYERLGWSRWQGPSYVVRDGVWVRTPDEDDGVMVLHSVGMREVASRIAVDDRPGDAW